MTNQIEIQTSRLILKSITPAIIHELFNTKSEEEIKAYFGFDDAGFEHHKEMHEKGMETHRLSIFVFLMIEKESGLPIGVCGFHTWNATHRRAEVFYNMRAENQKRKGFMTEALKVVLEYGFTKLNLHRIEALIAAENEPSLRLLMRYGFTKEGTMREDYVVDGKNEDSDCYSLLKWEWQKNSM
ncbi:MAG TPA: GNAT family protein [Flavobacterium sp.]|uniref:GNAT family N-acetyltransferase n=1 Tax=Flavobacterium sp. TaxID=239 RepID=UPI002BECBC02|nr:GNAT family protein [Flavobacterium sp.]HNP33777.1 GNAT family protein [Flavobacterium sp.]